MNLHKSYDSAKQHLWQLLCGGLVLLTLMAGCAAPVEEAAVAPTPVPEEAEPAPTEPPILPEEPEDAPPTLTPPAVPITAGQGDADVLFVSARLTGENVWSFSVTVEHNDTGWEDYADGWDVLLPDGTVLLPNSDDPFTRLLLHPHENEQPFTRSQSNIEIPIEVTEVTVRAHDLADGFGGQVVVVDLTAVSGQNFEVDR